LTKFDLGREGGGESGGDQKTSAHSYLTAVLPGLACPRGELPIRLDTVQGLEEFVERKASRSSLREIESRKDRAMINLLYRGVGNSPAMRWTC